MLSGPSVGVRVRALRECLSVDVVIGLLLMLELPSQLRRGVTAESRVQTRSCRLAARESACWRALDVLARLKDRRSGDRAVDLSCALPGRI